MQRGMRPRAGDDLSYYLGPGARAATVAQCQELQRTFTQAKREARMQRGTKLKIEAWLPMKDMSLDSLSAAVSTVAAVKAIMEQHGFFDIRITDRVISRKETKG